MKYIESENAPKAIGPYSPGVETDNGYIFLSGQLGLNPQSGELKSTLEDQTKQAFQNIHGLLESADLKKSDVCKVTVFITDMEKFNQVNEIYSDFFNDHKPARSVVGVQALPKNARIEIECIAQRK